jgi:hypothetical protein
MAVPRKATDAVRVMDHAPSELSARHVVRDGAVVAVLRTLDLGTQVKVTAELFDESPGGPVSRGIRPYTFGDRTAADAFVADAIGTFTYLGCEIRSAAA